jgi:hypothetical protein
MKAARQYVDQMPITVSDKEKITHLNAEHLLGRGRRRGAARKSQNERRQPDWMNARNLPAARR